MRKCLVSASSSSSSFDFLLHRGNRATILSMKVRSFGYRYKNAIFQVNSLATLIASIQLVFPFSKTRYFLDFVKRENVCTRNVTFSSKFHKNLTTTNI